MSFRCSWCFCLITTALSCSSIIQHYTVLNAQLGCLVLNRITLKYSTFFGCPLCNLALKGYKLPPCLPKSPFIQFALCRYFRQGKPENEYFIYNVPSYQKSDVIKLKCAPYPSRSRPNSEANRKLYPYNLISCPKGSHVNNEEQQWPPCFLLHVVYHDFSVQWPLMENIFLILPCLCKNEPAKFKSGTAGCVEKTLSPSLSCAVRFQKQRSRQRHLHFLSSGFR